MYSPSIQQLINAFSSLPSVGERTAERYVFYLLKSGKKEVAEFALALKNLMATIKSCEICSDFSDFSPCAICRDKNRDHSMICVVEDSQNLQAIEKLGSYKGVYHVLRGTLDSDLENLKDLQINELFARIKNNQTKEIILAFNPDLKGETTMMFLTRQIKQLNPKIKTTRLAKGLPMGSDLQYADSITLGEALKNRNIN